jgi:UbiD family decarboxylase
MDQQVKVIVVNEDIDPTDMRAVIHAFAARCHPQRGIHIHAQYPECTFNSLLKP